MPTIRGRGAQVALEGYARTVARGAAGRTMRDNIAAMDALVIAGQAADGNTVDGSSRTGGTPYDVVVAQFPRETLSAWAIPAPLLVATLADPVNVLDYGADPTGVADSAPAINNAAAQGKAVYLPTGTYHIRSRINLTNAQTMFGDGRGSTTLTVSDDFDPTETTCVVSLAANIALGGEAGPTVRDLCVSFAQPTDVTSRSSFKTIAAGGTSHLGGTGVQYPWAISATAKCRPIISHVRVQGAWDGITTGGQNAAYWLDDIEMGALDCGLSLAENGGVFDWCHINGYHFWPFGLSSGTILTGVFDDLQTIAMRVGAQNGLEARGIVSYEGQVIFTSEFVGGWADIVNLNLDNNGARLLIANARFMHITNFYAVADNTLGPTVTVGGGIVGFSNWYSQNSTQRHLDVSAGDVTVTGAFMQSNSTATGPIRVLGGRLSLSAVTLNPNAGGVWAGPLVVQNNTGILQVFGLDLTAAAGSSGTFVSYATDVPGNYLGSCSKVTGWTNIWQYGTNGYYGAIVVPPNDKTSMQAGAVSFAALPASSHNSTAFGYLSLGQVGTGVQNTAFGSLAGYGSLSGSHNTLIGSTAGYAASSTTGYSNTTIVGAAAGFNLTTGTNNTLIGFNAGESLADGSNNLYICTGIGGITGASPSESNTFRLGSNASRNVLRATNIDTTAPSLYLDWMPASTSYANDAAAATGGVGVGQLYRNGSAVMVRVA